MEALLVYNRYYLDSKSNNSDVHQPIGFCGQNDSFQPFWVDNGLSKCFFHTLVSSLLFILLVPMLYQIRLMKKKGITVESKYRQNSFWFKLQFLCMVVLLLESVLNFVLEYAYIHQHICGVSLLLLFSRTFSLIACLWLFILEHIMMLLSASYKGHSKIILFFWSFLAFSEILCVVSWNSPSWWFTERSTKDKEMEFYSWVSRSVLSLILFIIGFWSPGRPQLEYWLNINTDLDRDVENEEPLVDGQVEETTGSTWNGMKYKLKILLPYIWPAGSIVLQLKVLLCLLCLVAGRVVNPYVPIYSKKIINSLTDKSPWHLIAGQVTIYVLLRFLQGSAVGSGLINCTRSYFWLKVQQYTNRSVQVRLFDHLHSLSLRWHLSRKTGEVLRSIDRGTASINNILSYVMFNIAPTIIDIIIAITYFITAFDVWFGIIVFICLAAYMGTTIIITEWRTKFRRDMNLKDNKAKQRAVDSLLNFETVKYYNAESYEVGKFEEAIVDYQESEYKTGFSLVFLNFSQTFIINLGLFAGSLLCAKFVMDDKFEVGDYVLFGTYIIQLYVPLGFFGTYYRMIQSSFIDMENMFDLFKEDAEVVDNDDADVLPLGPGKVEFKNVSFHYKPERSILNDVSFTVEPGKTIALVGPSGSGKSTIIRLLLRFYEVCDGSIEIDGVDIASVTQSSLRDHIGVVPQDTILFNDDILNNIRYGRVTADDDEVIQAAKFADIHERIQSMPDKYLTKVGERGLKLSGGEKQRVAIARTLLKSPNIVLLDEATSALDTTTERNIQASLAKVCKDRTSIVVAHRLSTIVNSDIILVLKEGEIIERGSHDELINLGGMYSQLWFEQLHETTEDYKNVSNDDK